MSALLPLNLNRRFKSASSIPAEVIICGSASELAAKEAVKGNFVTPIKNCGRIHITIANPVWKMEIMPKPRLMADLLNLPTGDLLFINGAAKGAMRMVVCP